VSGQELASRFRAQAERFGVELLQAQDVVELYRQDNHHGIETGDGSRYSARAVLIAPGTKYRRLGVAGEEDYLGAGVHFCATCDGPFYKGRSVAVIGGGNSAAEESLFLTRFVDHVTLLVRGAELTASQIIEEKVLEHPQVDVRFHTEVAEFVGANSKLTAIRIRNTESGATETLELPGAFVFIGLDPNTAWLEGSGVELDAYGFVCTGHELVHDGQRPPGYGSRDPQILESSVPGVFAAGDVRAHSTKQVASAAGEGAAATLMIREYLKAT
jgi:thioredoxin reductase (NADPH)